MTAPVPPAGARWRQAGLFVINGLAATAIHYGALLVFLEVLRWPSAGLANGAASVIGIAASYLGNRAFVFRSRRPARATLPRFLALYAALALFHALFLALWTDRFGLPYGWGFLVSTAIATLLSFVGNRYFVFAEPSAAAQR